MNEESKSFGIKRIRGDSTKGIVQARRKTSMSAPDPERSLRPVYSREVSLRVVSGL